MCNNHTSNHGGPDREGGPRVRHDWTDRGCPSTAVVEAVAAATDSEITALPSLADHIDTDALDALLTASGEDVTVTFPYGGVEITVKGGGDVLVRLLR